ncbi:hypothetical protein T12_14767 [Trichinella patagoniensis]|uniref:Uncharacterized protein n=1 Tax=Trichinella patagoniensis TaxID=990121 RepID=A0A0V0ZET5_9BILA|nr:hypothetical protein T12_14767 [Trichinella patagoniensis]
MGKMGNTTITWKKSISKLVDTKIPQFVRMNYLVKLRKAISCLRLSGGTFLVYDGKEYKLGYTGKRMKN